MTKDENSIRVECWLCSSTQELTVEGVPDNAEVACSNCCAPIGNWQQLRWEGRITLPRH